MQGILPLQLVPISTLSTNSRASEPAANIVLPLHSERLTGDPCGPWRGVQWRGQTKDEQGLLRTKQYAKLITKRSKVLCINRRFPVPTPGTRMSRSVSPTTIPRLPTCGEQGSDKEVPPRSSRARCPTMRPTKSKPEAKCRSAFPANNYMSAVQSLDPRPLEGLHNERSYLLYELQKQGDRATRLFERYAAIEARLAGAQTAAETRKCKKEAALVRTKIAESTQQEQLILLRLGEIHVELQNRDRWMQVHHQPFVQTQSVLVYPLPALAPLRTSGSNLSEACCLSPCQEQDTPATERSTEYFTCGSRSGSVLSPLSPCFTPGVAFSEDIWSRASKTSAEKEAEDGSAPPESADEADEGSQRSQEVGRQVSREPEGDQVKGEACHEVEQYSPGHEENDDCTHSEDWNAELDAGLEDSQNWRAKLRRASFHFPWKFLKAEDKRRSLPYVKNMWSKSRRSSLHSVG
ncbi:uncharacterized protein B0T15DRAFT_144884 [Chaetomium strumarium]|uniref:Uncharacterized protein n=1 Tax=Chaetomium strumarium TaxID=1170767 RepID=A0AAJ0M2D7_9PEZI|nr:hypothetical protein B0T15DRAFT_144884 [Chaetomium strumarium]